MDEDNASRIEWVADDQVGKMFVVISTSGDLPSNPMCLDECMVCGGVFTRDESMEHAEAPCLPSSKQPSAAAGRHN